jgi:hypothetical protein
MADQQQRLQDSNDATIVSVGAHSSQRKLQAPQSQFGLTVELVGFNEEEEEGTSIQEESSGGTGGSAIVITATVFMVLAAAGFFLFRQTQNSQGRDCC